jgi:hypothetical protein
MDAVRPEWIEAVEDGQRLRGWIANAYAQIEYLLGDLIIRCRVFPDYASLTKTFTHSASKRAEKVRKMAIAAGPLAPFARDLLSILDRFEAQHETRNLLAHGFCEFLYTNAGEIGFRFRKFHRQPDRDDARLVRTFTPEAMQAEAVSSIALSQEALSLFSQLHNHFGWAGALEP